MPDPDTPPPTNDPPPPAEDAPHGGPASAQPFAEPVVPESDADSSDESDDEPPQPPKKNDPGADETIKETVEALVIAFILAFVFRAFVVEAFIIPTGSMAPTMLGQHLTCHCPSCGYRFDTNIDSDLRRGQVMSSNAEAPCPMCRYPVQVLAGTRVRAGDRILVDKFIYTFAEPRRWDVVVFKNPQESNDDGTPGPRTNYIKRLIALPGESVYLLDGDVFIAPPGDGEFAIARKPDPDENPHWERIQRAMWQPVYHSQYVPLVTGLPGHGQGTVDELRAEQNAWAPPWKVADNNTGTWDLGTGLNPARSYRFEGGRGLIEFDFDPLDSGVGYDSSFAVYPYNHDITGGTMTRHDREPIEDIRLAVSVRPTGDKTLVLLSTTARLDRPGRGTETLSATIDSDGWVIVQVPGRDEATRILGEPKRGPRLEPGASTDIELWVVDQQVSVWVGGEQVYIYDYDLTWEQVLERPEPELLPEVAIGIESADPVELYRVELDRDVYYSGRYSPRVGHITRQSSGAVPTELAPPHMLRAPAADHDAEYYVIGDNTPPGASQDARVWSSVDGWVQQRYFGGNKRTRVVPRSLLVGRAFFVYYPAPQPATHGDGGIIPDFSRMRFIH